MATGVKFDQHTVKRAKILSLQGHSAKVIGVRLGVSPSWVRELLRQNIKHDLIKQENQSDDIITE